MHRFYLPPEQCGGEVLHLDQREAHHAMRVLRMQAGDEITVLDGAGNQYVCKLERGGRNEAHATVQRVTRTSPLPWQVTLLQAIPKGKLLEEIIQKATEIGVHRIVPILSQRTVVHLNPKDCQEKLEKWRQVAVEAIKQCGCPWLPTIEPPYKPQEYLAQKVGYDLSLIASLQPGSQHPRRCFQEYHLKHDQPPQTVCVWIGPEGDFTPEEIAAIEASGARPITLGPQVLRADTAAIYSLSVMNYELQHTGTTGG